VVKVRCFCIFFCLNMHLCFVLEADIGIRDVVLLGLKPDRACDHKVCFSGNSASNPNPNPNSAGTLPHGNSTVAPTEGRAEGDAPLALSNSSSSSAVHSAAIPPVEEQPDWSKFLLDDYSSPGGELNTPADAGGVGSLEGTGVDADAEADVDVGLEADVGVLGVGAEVGACRTTLLDTDIALLKADFADLRRIAATGRGGILASDTTDGVCELVAAHMLELWAVQRVGASGAAQLLAEAAGLDPRLEATND
jgi:hypothetical protein